MFHRSWAKCLSALAILAATSFPALAIPYIVNFEPGGWLVDDGKSYTENGIRFSLAGGGAMIDTSFCDPINEYCAVGNDTSYLSALNDATVTVEREDAKAFSLTRFDASYFPTPWEGYVGETVRLLWSGTKFGGGTSNGQFDLLGDIVTENYSFMSFSDANMTQLTSLTFSACFIVGDDCIRGGDEYPDWTNLAQFALDNLRFDDDGSTVPEPSMLLLMALGLSALTVSRRRATR